MYGGLEEDRARAFWGRDLHIHKRWKAELRDERAKVAPTTEQVKQSLEDNGVEAVDGWLVMGPMAILMEDEE